MTCFYTMIVNDLEHEFDNENEDIKGSIPRIELLDQKNQMQNQSM